MAMDIEINSLTKSYEQHVALDGLTLSIADGEIFGFLGHNGAGKTTTVNILTTLLAPSSGSARICGHDVSTDSMSVRQCIGYVPENVRLYETMSAWDNLVFFARLSGVANPANAVQSTLKIFDCENLAQRRVGSMSKGQRQRIGLAQAMVHRPKVLFLDEPTSGLDPLGIKTLRDLIVRLNREFGTTVFMNTHLISEVSKCCTSIGVLNQGRLVFDDTLQGVMERFGEDFSNESSLEQLYLSVTPEVVA